MELNTIATELLPFLVKGGEQLASVLGKDLWETIRSSFAEDEDSQELLDNFQENPANPEHIGAIKQHLKRTIKSKPDTAVELEEKLLHIKEYNKQHVNVTGDKNITLTDINNSKISIKK